MEQAGQGTLGIRPGFTTAAGFQETFRAVLEVMSRPGKILPAGTSLDPPEPLLLPAKRNVRLQNLARADEGFLLSMAYSLQRGFGFDAHPFLGEIRYGEVGVEMVPEELGFPVEIGAVEVTECVMINRFAGSAEHPPEFKTGYGLVFGHCERKAMSMSMVDRALRCRELGEDADYPAQDEEFVLCHSDNVEASGFVQHLKLPHYVDFQADLNLMRRMRADHVAAHGGGEEDDRG